MKRYMEDLCPGDTIWYTGYNIGFGEYKVTSVNDGVVSISNGSTILVGGVKTRHTHSGSWYPSKESAVEAWNQKINKLLDETWASIDRRYSKVLKLEALLI